MNLSQPHIVYHFMKVGIGVREGGERGRRSGGARTNKEMWGRNGMDGRDIWMVGRIDGGKGWMDG